MFYSKFLFVKKGALSNIWLAACKRKLSKVQIVQTNIEKGVGHIVEPQTPLALRLSGQLLLGLVRIYQKKVRYLHEDCNEALNKMNMVFRAGSLANMPEEVGVASNNAITLPDNFDALDLEVEFPLDMDILDAPIDEIDIDPSMEGEHVFEDEMDLAKLNMDMEEAKHNEETEKSPTKDEQETKTLEQSKEHDEQKKKMEEDLELEIPLDVPEGVDDFVPDDMFDMEMPEMQDESDLKHLQSNDQQQLELDISTIPEFDDEVEEEEAKKQPKKATKKRKRVTQKVDTKVELGKSALKKQLKDTSDIVSDRAPQDAESIVDSNKRQRFHRSLAVKGMALSLVNLIRRGFEENAPRALEEGVDAKEYQQRPAEEEEFPVDPNFDEGFEMPEMQDFDDLDPLAGEEKKGADVLHDDQQQLLPAGEDEFFFDDSKEGDEHKDGDDDASKEKNKGGWSKRTRKMYHYLATQLETENDDEKEKELSYETMVQGKPRQTAAGMFYELLVLKTHDYIQVQQEQPFGDIHVSKAQGFDQPIPGTT